MSPHIVYTKGSFRKAEVIDVRTLENGDLQVKVKAESPMTQDGFEWFYPDQLITDIRTNLELVAEIKNLDSIIIRLEKARAVCIHALSMHTTGDFA